MNRTLLVLALLLVACGRSEAPAARDTARAVASPAAVSMNGYAGIRPPMSLSEASRILGEPLNADYSDNEGCDYVQPASFPAGVNLMVVHDTVVRVDIDSAGVATNDGVRVGDSEAMVRSRYGSRLVVSPHPYAGPEGHYLTLESATDSMHRMILETDGTRITSYRVGVRPMVDWIEACS